MRNVWNIFAAVGVMIADRATKCWALGNLQGQEQVVTSYLNFSFVWNRGVSWGMFNGSSALMFWGLTFAIAAVMGLFAGYTVMQHKRGELIFFETLVLSGAASNFFDRLYYGAVIDFIDFHAWGWHWPTFNVADACIVIGIGGIILRGFLWARSKE